jgi:nucleoside-diphosphate-sugar epimerase
MAKILVTGASGFVGRQLCATLTERGDEVLAGVRSADSGVTTGAEPVVVGDLSAGPLLAPKLRGVDAVVHLAARTHVMRETASDPEAAFRRSNVTATESLARQAAAVGVRRLVLLSSVKVNGERTADRPFTEEDAAAPEDAYGRSKLEAERALQAIATESGLEVVVARPPLVYGPGVKGNLLRLLQWVDRGTPLPLARVRNQRSLVGIWNLCDLIALCVAHPAAAGQTFLVSDQQDLSTPALIRAMATALGKRPRLVPFPVPVLRGVARVVGQAAAVDRLTGSLQVSSAKAVRVLGWRPRVPVQEGLQRTVDWYRRSR